MSSQEAAIALADSDVAARAADYLLADAIAEGAHTLHLEPHLGAGRIRYRINGALHNWAQLSEHTLHSLINHLKLRAGLHPHEDRFSQEGRFALSVDGVAYHIKVSTLPLASREKAVLHILDTRHTYHNLAELGLWGLTKKRLSTALTAPQGLIVVSGTRHSGVSTTLRSILHTLNEPTRHVVSIQESPKHHMQGVSQLRVNRQKGHDVAQLLETALRGDANVIAIDNLYGSRATSRSVVAANDGRFVVAGMRSASLLHTMSQLQAANDEQYLLAHNLRAVLHQKLVRRLCDNCKIPAKPNAAQLKAITGRTRITISTLQQFLEETNKHQPRQPLQLFMARPSGCAQCRHTGFKGQIGLFELFYNNPEATSRLANHGNAVTILHHAVNAGMMPIMVDGLIKALSGLTTLDEVLQQQGKIT